MIETEDARFASDVLDAPGAVLVEFWAEWCGPCRELAPILSTLAAQCAAVKLVRIDVDRNQTTVLMNKVCGLPSLLLFVHGVERERVLGLPSTSHLLGLVGRHTP